MDKPLISLENIEKSYGRERVLGPLSLEVRPGEIVGVTGENGAGKSTLMRIIAGAQKPDRGTVRRFEARAGEIGYVPQEPALYSSLTGMQNLRYWATAVGLFGKRRRVRCRYLLRLVNLTDKAHKRVSSYSGGMKRRLNLACALVGDVKLLLLDEPTVGADARSAELMIEAIANLRKTGCAVMIVSHIKEDIERLADRVITLDAGEAHESKSAPPAGKGGE